MLNENGEGAVPDSWRQAFERSLRKHAAGDDGPGAQSGIDERVLAEIEEALREAPLEPVDDEGMNDLHRAALRSMVRPLVTYTSSDLELASRECASPIEKAMLCALSNAAWGWSDGVLWRVDGTAYGRFASTGTFIEIEPQAQVGRYRVDFLLTMKMKAKTTNDRLSVSMVVECDGHEWHERSREQARRDRRRDRELQGSGLPVFRYTGSEIWEDVFASANEALGALSRRMDGEYRRS